VGDGGTKGGGNAPFSRRYRINKAPAPRGALIVLLPLDTAADAATPAAMFVEGKS
jgi:hypothetical protein